MAPYSVLKNVLVSAGANRLQLVDIRFNSQIREIRPKLNEPIDWETISTPDRLQQFQQRLPGEQRGAENAADGQFRLLIPGGIDPHVHFDTPGFEFREDFEHASTAAATGGVTTVIDMPCTSVPPVTNVTNMNRKLEALQGRSLIDFALWGGVSGTDFGDEKTLKKNIFNLANAGVAGFKTYFISGMEKFTDLNPYQFYRAARWIRETGLPMAVHAEEKSLVLTRQSRFMNQGRNDWHAYCESRDVLAEAAAIALLIEIVRETGVRGHVVHLSSARGLQLIREAKKQGLPITAETCPHYLYFTQADFDNPAIRNFLKTAPPVKFAEDREALWDGLREGLLEFVTTDHAGCLPEKEKSSPDFWQVYGGIPGVEHRVPFLLSEGFLKGRLSLENTLQLLCGNPAKFFGLHRQKGGLTPGKDADFALIDLWSEYPVRAAQMHSKGKYTPFEGVLWRAGVVATWLRGRKIWDRKQGASGVEMGYGHFVQGNDR